MSEARGGRVSPADSPVPFGQINDTLEQQALAGAARLPVHALTATVVVIGAHERLVDAAVALEGLTGTGAVRAILISGGDDPAPAARVRGQAIALEGLLPRYFNNAVAALRLSSLPTLVWWRGARGDSLEGVAELADRLVLDVEDPLETWGHARRLLGRTALSDLRWARLTRWRALMAHFFDIHDVRPAAASFERLELSGADLHSMRLFASWLSSVLGWRGQVSVDLRELSHGLDLEAVRLRGGGQELELALTPSGTCVQATARLPGHAALIRMAALGDQRLSALIAEELRVRSRDLAFERALCALEEAS